MMAKTLESNSTPVRLQRIQFEEAYLCSMKQSLNRWANDVQINIEKLQTVLHYQIYE